MKAFDEMDRAEASPYAPIEDWLKTVDSTLLSDKRDEAYRLFIQRGITFAVYGDDGGSERLIPFDVVPRIIAAADQYCANQGIKYFGKL